MKLPPLLDLVTRRFEHVLIPQLLKAPALRVALLPLYLVGFVAVMETR